MPAVMSDLPSAEQWWIALGKIWIIICLFFLHKSLILLLSFCRFRPGDDDICGTIHGLQTVPKQLCLSI